MKEFKLSPQELNERLKWSLDEKFWHSVSVFLQYYCFCQGRCYQSFSAGKDSQIVAEIIDMIFSGKLDKNKLGFELYISLYDFKLTSQFEIDGKFSGRLAYQKIIIEKIWGVPPKKFCDTGLEFEEIRRHAKTFDDVEFLRPARTFMDVLENTGVAVGSKSIAEQIVRVKRMLLNRSAKNDNTYRLYTTGIDSKGNKSKRFGLKGIWKKIALDETVPFKVSGECCNVFKKQPFDAYEIKSGRIPITGTTVEESMDRRIGYLQTGCNSFGEGKEFCRMIALWTEEDVWEFSKIHGIRFCIVYYDRFIKIPDGDGGYIEIFILGESRTGCMFCLFGIQHEPKDKPNRFQRLAITHPKRYEFMLRIPKLKAAMDFIGIDYRATEKHFKHLAKQKTLF